MWYTHGLHELKGLGPNQPHRLLPLGISPHEQISHSLLAPGNRAVTALAVRQTNTTTGTTAGTAHMIKLLPVEAPHPVPPVRPALQEAFSSETGAVARAPLWC